MCLVVIGNLEMHAVVAIKKRTPQKYSKNEASEQEKASRAAKIKHPYFVNLLSEATSRSLSKVKLSLYQHGS